MGLTPLGEAGVEPAPVPEEAGPLGEAGVIVSLGAPGVEPASVPEEAGPLGAGTPGAVVELARHSVQIVEVEVSVIVDVVIPVDTDQVVPELMVLVTGHTVVVV